MIGVTQPRRVAAVSTCQRVGEELNVDARAIELEAQGKGELIGLPHRIIPGVGGELLLRALIQGVCQPSRPEPVR